jgi:hypothetical protein
LRSRVALVVVLGLPGCLAWTAPASAAAPAITASTITSPANGAELFYNGDSGGGSVTVKGTVTGAGVGSTGDLVCYTSSDTSHDRRGKGDVATGIAVSSGSFAAAVSLANVAGDACRLALVPAGTIPTGAAAAAFQGPKISVSDQSSLSTNGNLYGYDILSGTLPWSFEFDSLGNCSILDSTIPSSWATDPSALISNRLFHGMACLPQTSGIAAELFTRSALQVDGLNAYPPGAIGAPPPPNGDSGLTGDPGFEPLDYNASFNATHDTVTITETDIPTICDPPAGFPPTSASCPSLHDSGIQVQQTTTLLPGGQVARVSQKFTSVDGKAHTIDALFQQGVQAPANGRLPGFQFPGQTSFASHAAPDSYSLFGPGPGSIIVVADSTSLPATSNPIGAITYGRPPSSANFISATGARTAAFVMHYTDSIPANGSVSYDWSYSQAADSAGLAPLERVERDRFFTPSVSISSPRSGVVRTASMSVRGSASDPVGITSFTVNGVATPLHSDGTFSALLTLRRGANAIVASATNAAGNVGSASVTITYQPFVCVVPKLRGKTLHAARVALGRAHCRVGKIHRVRSHRVRKGRVLSSAPRAGSHRGAGTKVGLVVSRGR